MNETQPPLAMLGGLNVALLAARGSDAEALAALRGGLEEQGVNVYVLSPGGPEAQPLHADQRIADADPMGFDGVMVVGGAEGVEHLRTAPESLEFIRQINRDHKPVGALGEGVLLLLDTGLCEQERWVTAAEREELRTFSAAFQNLLEQRRRTSFAREVDDSPSSVGEDG